ncbi:SDR family oxidoreductase [Martelella mediterranea]|uniref:SDR family NAD(P)-dependent oxidoreductase n=1 Tax=Martelella mediterranea TaxID=293089 RepID=UPI001E2BEBE3|nr:SDR family NAD(P)-dependent oxidoreductase [Martelella mediterranea]MCD1635820.1 SDR family oxidoreductase [Martelella mediterranea]
MTLTLENPGAALITGASRGIGRAIAERFGADRYHVLLSDLERQRGEAETVVETIRNAGGRADFLPCDVGDPKSIETLSDDALALSGGIRVLINNAGVLSVSSVDDLSPEEWDRMYQINTRGTFLVTQAMLPHLRKQDRARIINIASIGGKRGAPGQIHYCSSKAAVISFTQILAEEVAQDGINVNAICPGIIDTDMGRNNYRTPEALAAVHSKTALKRLGYPEDVSGPVAFLASDDAAFITGQAINVCGGIIFH